ncbi:MAG: hypothetical protein QXD25_01505 [Nanopusillaceae archaeon]
MDKFELIKSLGVLLIGIGILIGSIVFYLIYQKTVNIEGPFYANCEGFYITIKANRDLTNVSILYKDIEVCNFPLIKKNKYKVCNISDFLEENKTISFIISSEEFGEKVIHCYNYRTIPV